MKKMAIFLLVLVTLTAMVATVAAAGREPHRPQQSERELRHGKPLAPNQLENPSFEGDYSAYVPPGGSSDCPSGRCDTAQMPPGWTPWWRSHTATDPDYIIRMPEYKPASPAFTDPVRVRTGAAAQQYFTFWSNHEAGFYQQVAVTPGTMYTFRIWGHAWSAQDDDNAYSGPEDGNLFQKIGIDPTAGTDWQSPDIIWSAARKQYDVYGLFQVTAVAQADTITVFTYSYPAYPVKHNDVYWDDASLVAVTEDPAITLAPGRLNFLAPAGASTVLSQTVHISLTGDTEMGWTAVLSSTRSFTPTLSAESGASGEPLVIGIDSGGYITGTYTATVTVASTPPVASSPIAVPIRLVVAPEIHAMALPSLRRP